MKPSKRGAALLASLLLLGLLMVLTLLYVAIVRLEGQIADWSQAEQRARGGLDTALAWALADIGETYAGRVYAMPGQEDDWVSLGEGGAVTGLADEFTAQLLGWPERYRGSGPGTLVDRAASATWETHGDTNSWHLATAWVGVDLSGLLDPHHLNFSAQAVRLEEPPARRYITPGEFTADHPGTSTDEPPGVTQVFLPNNHALDRGWYDNGVWQARVEVDGRSISPNLAEWDQDDIRAVFAALYPHSNIDELTAAFLDFRSGADAPAEVDSLTAVPIPMFNEVAAELTLTNTAGVIRVEVRVQLEIWFPNLGSTVEQRFRVSESPAILPESIGLTPQETLEQWEFDTPAPFTVLSMRFVREAAELGQTITLEIPLENLEIERMSDERVLDRIASELVLRFEDVPVPPEGGTVTRTRIYEALDPKLNHRLKTWVPREADTLGALNASASGLGPLYTVFQPGFLDENPANIGFFPLDRPWETVNLFGEDGRWFHRHTRRAAWAPGWRTGKINPNSSYEQVLEAVIQAVRIERFPNDPEGRLVNPEESRTLAGALQREVGEGNGFVQRGDWTKALQEMDFQTEFGWDRFQAESLVRRLNGVFETSQQYWGLVLMAEWRSPAGVARGRSRAAALIRRDPFADADGRHSWARQLWIPLP